MLQSAAGEDRMLLNSLSKVRGLSNVLMIMLTSLRILLFIACNRSDNSQRVKLSDCGKFVREIQVSRVAFVLGTRRLRNLQMKYASAFHSQQI
jgi:hypothetical protein